MKILLVDDERTEREGIRFLIEKFQFELEVAEAANGKLAMEYLQKYQDVDILLTDVKMPYMDGLQLAKYAKENRPDVIIIIFSAYSEFDYAKKACGQLPVKTDRSGGIQTGDGACHCTLQTEKAVERTERKSVSRR